MKLIVINGPCGVGKSTLAAKLHKDMPLSFLLDIDAQSAFISNGTQYNEERWEMTLALSGAVISSMLRIGRSVIVDKMTYATSVLDSYYTLAEKYGAEIYEITLWGSKTCVLGRADMRGWHPSGVLTPEKVGQFWDRIQAIKDQRVRAHLIDTEEKSPEEVYAIVKDLIE